jgi:hypothetical protein
MKTIYVSLATMDDDETKVTIENIFNDATHPERIFIGLSCSTKNKKFYKEMLKVAKNKNVKVLYTKLTKNSFEDYGTGQARFKAHSMYDGQDYFLQCDSHTNFEPGWDETLINLYEEARSTLNYDKIVLTAYLGLYEWKHDGKSVIDSRSRYPFYSAGLFNNEYARWKDLPLDDFGYKDKFYPCVKFNGNFAFGGKEFAQKPGIYKDAHFYDEEIVQSINLKNNDFYMVFPNIKLPVTHLYSNYINKFGGKRMHFAEYMPESNNMYLSNVARKKYSHLINNKDYVKKYEEYAKINLRVGLYSDNDYIPERY